MAATLQGILDLGAVVVVLLVAARRSDDNHVRRASDRLVADYGPWARAASGRATGKRFARFKIAVSVQIRDIAVVRVIDVEPCLGFGVRREVAAVLRVPRVSRDRRRRRRDGRRRSNRRCGGSVARIEHLCECVVFSGVHSQIPTDLDGSPVGCIVTPRNHRCGLPGLGSS